MSETQPESGALCDRTATELVAMTKRGELSARELLAAQLDRIEQVNGELNAIVTLVPEMAEAWALEADERQVGGADLGPLHGLPVAHKDLVATAGIRSTSGSLLLANNVPTADDLIVTRMRGAGAITLGKTNTPEFGAGSHTFNEIFGATRNPWNQAKTPGGSSGGAAAALSAGMVALADGSDMGGSLRNPASFCGVVGLRPSTGRVPDVPVELAGEQLAVLGPMGRTVADVALLLAAQAGPDARDPRSTGLGLPDYSLSLDRNFAGTKIAFDADLGGLPFDPVVAEVTEKAVTELAGLGVEIEAGGINWSGANEAFHGLRGWFMAGLFADLPGESIEALKPTLKWNIGVGRSLSGIDVARAEMARTRVAVRFAEFMEQYEFVVMPVSQVVPFDVETEYPTEIDGHEMENYIDWMRSAFYVSVTGHPAISVPCGFTPDGLPVGLQIVGRRHDELGVLQLANAYEQSLGLDLTPPPLATG